MKKFELTENCKIYNQKKLFQIRALRDLDCGVKAGDFGGYVENECNLDQFGDAWVFGNARVFDSARVSGSARVFGDAKICGSARVFGNAKICGCAQVFGKAEIYDCALVHDNAQIFGDAWVFSNALIGGNARVGGTAQVGGNARVFSNDDILQITGLGTYGRTTTAFNTRSGVHVNCGCFCGDINQFRKRVEQTRDGKVRAEYLKFAELVEIYFSKGENA